MAKPKSIVLPAVAPNPSVGKRLRDRLEAMADEMRRSVEHWVEVQWREDPPETTIGTDAAPTLWAMSRRRKTPADEMAAELERLAEKWIGRFDEAAVEIAEYFARSAQGRSDARLKTILKRYGISVKFKATPAQRDVAAATVIEATSLIKSIPQKYMTDVQGAVMRSVQTGRDLGSLSDDLQRIAGVTKKRAAIISRDQNAKATASMNRARQIELGITKAVWQHSSAGKTPRPSHVKAGRNKVKYDVREGWFDPNEKKHILPGQLPNCRCTSRSVISGT